VADRAEIRPLQGEDRKLSRFSDVRVFKGSDQLPMTTLVTTRTLLAVAVALAAWLSVPAAANAYTIGISDQKTGMWQDPRFAQLGVRQVRLMMAYDSVLAGDFRLYDHWMSSAHARGAEVLLTITHHSRVPSRLPSNKQYRRVVRILVKRYPWVKTMSAWNEANHHTQPTYRHPRRAAQYYNIMRKECRGCRVVAADVLDGKNMLPWLAKFKRYAKDPRIWGLHSYGDTNHFRPLRATATRQLLAAVKGEVWLTETGGIVRFGSSFPGGRRGEARAAKAVKRTFKVARSSGRIKRVYLYHWDADRKFKTWDSAFVAANGRARPALDVLRNELNRQRRGRAPALPKLSRYPKTKLALN
jgi:polysaccharide biosynthesis protein PslG